MGEHADLSPSSSGRWFVCALAPRREKNLPDSSGPAAEWGTACHSVLEKALLSGESPTPQAANEFYFPLDETVQKIGSLQEMCETAEFAFEYVMRTKHSREPAALRAEEKVDPGSAIGRTDCWGTADVIIASQMVLEVIDLKSGAGVQVEPTDHQLTLYAVGALIQYGGRSAPFELVIATIVQPRGSHPNGPIRSVEYTVEYLIDWCEQDFARAALATDDPNAVATPSEDGCRWCKAKVSDCPEIKNHALNAVQGMFGNAVVPIQVDIKADLAPKLTREPSALDPEELRYILDNEKLITGWLSSVKTYALEKGNKGEHIPGYKLVAGKSNRKWDNSDVVKKCANLKSKEGRLGKLAMLSAPALMSPAQAEKKVKPLVTKKVWEKISKMIVKSSGAPTLAPISDSRPAMITTADEMFKDVKNKQVEPDLSFLN